MSHPVRPPFSTDALRRRYQLRKVRSCNQFAHLADEQLEPMQEFLPEQRLPPYCKGRRSLAVKSWAIVERGKFMFVVEVRYQRRLLVGCTARNAYALISDIPRSAACFPELKELVHVEDNTYHWVLNSIGGSQFATPASFACRYTMDASKAVVQWKPIGGSRANTRFQGHWRVREVEEQQVELSFTTKTALQLPLSPLIKQRVSPVFEHELERTFGEYLRKVCETLEQG